MPKLIINRKSEWINSMRDVRVYLDGELLGMVQNGQSSEFGIPSGEHTLITRMDWYGSKPLTLHVGEKESLHIELTSFKFGKWLSPLAFLLILGYYGFRQQFHISTTLFLVIIIPLCAYFFYYLTLGRNSYLRLRRI